MDLSCLGHQCWESMGVGRDVRARVRRQASFVQVPVALDLQDHRPEGVEEEALREKGVVHLDREGKLGVVHHRSATAVPIRGHWRTPLDEHLAASVRRRPVLPLLLHFAEASSAVGYVDCPGQAPQLEHTHRWRRKFGCCKTRRDFRGRTILRKCTGLGG